MNQIKLKAIAPNNPFDDRTLLIVEIDYNDELFEWEVRVPPTFTGTWDEWIQTNSQNIFSEVESKLQEWENLNPKTRQVPGILGREATTVPIQREEIVRSTYPDYYVNRAKEYPPLKEQLGAILKGGNDLLDMQAEIEAIKQKYPKTS